MSISKTPDNMLTELGLRLEKCRKDKYGDDRGSLKKCADDLGTSPQNWNDYEAGRRELGFGKIVLFAEFFNVDPGWLLTGNTHEWTEERFILTDSISRCCDLFKKMMLDYICGQLEGKQVASALFEAEKAIKQSLKIQED